MMRRIAPAALAAFLSLQTIAAPATAQSGDNATAGCTVAGYPCIVAIPFAITAALFVLVMVRIVILVRRIRRGPTPPDDDQDVPPDLRGSIADRPPADPIPGEPTPWPDDDALERPRVIREGPTQHITWGDHRLWFDGERYLFSVDGEVPDHWLPCFTIPKGHRIVVGPDKVPRLERFDPRLHKGQE